jgi:hypothetical protein
MVGRENVAVERNRNNDKHQHFGVVLNGLEDNQFTLPQQGTADRDGYNHGRTDEEN